MLKTVKLILPALLPSWRFFDVVAPSPRIEFAVLEGDGDAPMVWREFRPRPARLSVVSMLGRMVWNPHWNESLFMMSCAERIVAPIVAGQEEHSRGEIMQRIRDEVEGEFAGAAYLQFRLVFIAREREEMVRHIAYLSPIEALDGGDGERL